MWDKSSAHYLNVDDAISAAPRKNHMFFRRRALSLAANSAFPFPFKPAFSSDRILRRLSSQPPKESRRLEGKVAIITGGASGFGEATAKTFVAHGAKVIIGDINDELGRRVCAALHPHADFLHCNVAQEKDVSALVDFALSRHGQLNIMFNNAGIGGRWFKSIAEMSIEDFQSIMDVNVRGVVAGVKHAARAMISQNNKGGCILCSASIASLVALKSLYAYTISKHAVVGIVKSAASDLAPFGIRVNCISPYAVATPLVLSLLGNPGVTRESVSKHFEKFTDFRGATLEPDDIAKAALFLGSDDARYISGLNLVIDGGFTTSKELHLTT